MGAAAYHGTPSGAQVDSGPRSGGTSIRHFRQDSREIVAAPRGPVASELPTSCAAQTRAARNGLPVWWRPMTSLGAVSDRLSDTGRHPPCISNVG
jgi:hypothetical protein